MRLENPDHFRHRAGAQQLVVAEQPAELARGEAVGEREDVRDSSDVLRVPVVAKWAELPRPLDDLARVVRRAVVRDDEFDFSLQLFQLRHQRQECRAEQLGPVVCRDAD